MGLFDKRKKKKEPDLPGDEKKLREIAEYQSREHQVIRDLQIRTLGKSDAYIGGRVYCRLWNKEIDIDLYDDVPLEYAHKCVEAMNSMPDDLIDKICRAAKKYCLDFLDTAAERSTLISMF